MKEGANAGQGRKFVQYLDCADTVEAFRELLGAKEGSLDAWQTL
jgi:hypothetical protein